jgi:hypothetical protein
VLSTFFCGGVLLALVTLPSAWTSAHTLASANAHTRQHTDTVARIAARLVAMRDTFDGAASVGDDALCRTFVDVLFGTACVRVRTYVCLNALSQH